MRIISKFHDYYDHAAGFGIDLERLYVRTKVVYEYQKKDRTHTTHPEFLLNRSAYGYDTFMLRPFDVHELGIEPFVVIFVGKMFYGFKVTDRCVSKYGLSEGFSPIQGIFYDPREIILLLRRRNKMKDDEENTRSMDSLYGHDRELQQRAREINQRAECIRQKVPVMLYTATECVYNPCLKDIEFYRVVDPYTAFQELDMFVGGVLAFPGAVMVDISDKDMAAKKGFGHPYAFRAEPDPSKTSKIRRS